MQNEEMKKNWQKVKKRNDNNVHLRERERNAKWRNKNDKKVKKQKVTFHNVNFFADVMLLQWIYKNSTLNFLHKTLDWRRKRKVDLFTTVNDNKQHKIKQYTNKPNSICFSFSLLKKMGPKLFFVLFQKSCFL